MRLRDYYGERVRLTINGWRVNPDTKERHRISIQRVGQLDTYADMFGPGSLYAAALRVVRNKASLDDLIVSSLSIEFAESADENNESGFGE